MKLWFEDRYKCRQEVGDCKNWREISLAINAFIAGTNAMRKMDATPYKIHYLRTWDEDGEVVIDIGSHSEFFIWEGSNAQLLSEIMEDAE